MAKVIKLGRLGDALDDILNEIKDSEIKAAERAYRATLIDRLGAIMIDTPVDRGRLRGAWILADAYNAGEVGRVSKNKGENYIKTQLSGKPLLGRAMYFFNNLPYAHTVEYGGYPKSVKKGSYNKQRGKYEILSAGGFSQQAPKGMLRVNLISFGRRLKQAWKAQRKNG